jgi:hypothetical protein
MAVLQRQGGSARRYFSGQRVDVRAGGISGAFDPKPVGLAVDTAPAGHLPPCLTALVEKPVNKGSWPALETITALPIDIVRE